MAKLMSVPVAKPSGSGMEEFIRSRSTFLLPEIASWICKNELGEQEAVEKK
jgi:hypothetical protein